MEIDEMKFQDMPDQLRPGVIESINKLSRDIAQVWDYWLEHCVKYVSFTNAGGIIAMLTFMNSRNIRAVSWSGLALLLFVIGLILVGIIILYMFLRFKVIYENTEKDVNELYAGNIQWGHFIGKIKERKKFHNLALWLGFGTAGCFFIGLVVGIISFITY